MLSVFATAYESGWQHPGIAWIAGAPLLLLGLVAWWQGRAGRGGSASGDPDPRRRAWVAAFLLLELEIVLDAWLTGAWSPVGTSGRAANNVAICCVILGDLRFFYLVERQRGVAAPGLRALGRALAVALPVSLILPVATGILNVVSPRYSDHLLYIVYELAMLPLALVFGWTRLRAVAVQARTQPMDARDGRARYVRRLLVLELAQYALWALADGLILAGMDAGFLVRMLPNALYYAAFVPVATLSTPQGARV